MPTISSSHTPPDPTGPHLTPRDPTPPQPCINYANEKLQSQFIEALVASQRAEYEAEGVACGSLDFPDNSEVLRLLEGKVHSNCNCNCNCNCNSEVLRLLEGKVGFSVANY